MDLSKLRKLSQVRLKMELDDWVLYVPLKKKVLALQLTQMHLDLRVITSHLYNELVPGDQSWAPSVFQLWEWGVKAFVI